MDPIPLAEPFADFFIAALPALLATCFSTLDASVRALSGSRLASLGQEIGGTRGRALSRCAGDTGPLHTRWLVLQVLGAATSAVLFYRLFGAWPWGVALGMSAAVSALIYGIPATILMGPARHHAANMAPALLSVLRPIEALFVVFTFPLERLTKALGERGDDAMNEVEAVVLEGERKGTLAADQSELIRNILDVEDRTAGDVMVPRTQVVALNIANLADDVVAQVLQYPHSRFPVYRGRKDNVLGILHVKDLIRSKLANEPAVVESMMRSPALFIPENTLVFDALNLMRAKRQHLAVIVDEFGDMCGIATLEDLLEEIVGEIRDEHDLDEPPIVAVGDGILLVDASVSLADLERDVDVSLEEGDYHSLGGYLVHALGHVPHKGQSLVVDGVKFTVQSSDARRIEKIEIVLPESQRGSAAGPPGRDSHAA